MSDIAMVRMLEERDAEIERLRKDKQAWQDVAENYARTITRLRTIVAQYFDDSDPPLNLPPSDDTKKNPRQ